MNKEIEKAINTFNQIKYTVNGTNEDCQESMAYLKLFLDQGFYNPIEKLVKPIMNHVYTYLKHDLERARSSTQYYDKILYRVTDEISTFIKHADETGAYIEIPSDDKQLSILMIATRKIFDIVPSLVRTDYGSVIYADENKIDIERLIVECFKDKDKPLVTGYLHIDIELMHRILL